MIAVFVINFYITEVFILSKYSLIIIIIIIIIHFAHLFRKSLTWRDVQHLIVRSSRNDIIDKNVKWTVNKAGIRGKVFFASLFFFNTDIFHVENERILNK